MKPLNRVLSVALVACLIFFAAPTGAAVPGTSGAPVPEIVGGTEVPPGAYPFMAALVYSGYANAKNGQFCGGSMIDAEWILTAAHCTDGSSPGNIDVVVGRDTLTTDDGERIGVAEIHEHPGYDSVTYENDIALLRLESPATVGDPIRWVIDGEADLFAAGTLATTIGWGYTKNDPEGTGTGGQDTLREVDVPIRTTAECVDSLPPGEFYEGEMICAGYPAGGKDSCQGDSGGPLIITTGTGMAHVGIVSWGHGCADKGEYGFYARTATFSDWILEVAGINECAGIHPTLVGTAAGEDLLGTARTDVIHGEGGDDTILGRGGDDILCGGPGNDYLKTGSGNDHGYGEAGRDTLLGMGGMDSLHGGSGGDVINGGPDDDTLIGGGGNDTILGGGGDDAIDGNTGNDTLKGQAGDDEVRGGADNDTLSGWLGADALYGGGGEDVIKGGPDDDVLRGEAGDDTLRGGAGDDTIYGNSGDDALYGGTGIDGLYGGDDTDICTAGEIGFSSCETIV